MQCVVVLVSNIAIIWPTLLNESFIERNIMFSLAI